MKSLQLQHNLTTKETKMFEEIAKKFEEIITSGIKDVREDVASIKKRIEELEGKVFLQEGIAVSATEVIIPDQIALTPAEVTEPELPTSDTFISDAGTQQEEAPSLENIPA